MITVTVTKHDQMSLKQPYFISTAYFIFYLHIDCSIMFHFPCNVPSSRCGLCLCLVTVTPVYLTIKDGQEN